jgi:hypothetical protein
LGLAYAQEQDTTSSIDQALIELSNLEQNQIALQNLITERENIIAEKERLLNRMTLQYQSLDDYCLLLKNENKFVKMILGAVIVVAAGEAGYLVGEHVLNWW